MSSPLIRVKDLHKIYVNEGVRTHAIRGVSFDIHEGEFIAIMGPSGSGKSTLMQMLGFLDRPSKGKYFFRGENVKSFSDDELADIRNKEVGFVFQTFNLLSRTTVYENVELPLLYNRHLDTKEDIDKMIQKALESVMMEHRINYFSNQLSGGEKQRVAIARALINNPQIIFADEPTGNLDSKSGLQVMKTLEDLNEMGKTIILVTHETYTAQHAERVIKIADGEIIKDGKIVKRRKAKGSRILK